ncbi:hypothetical protein [Streptomyces violaceus]|uniref:hypothetical protein n=1 Tax=Streptomyces violaceus TaxID=1936 RepID=UPI0038B504FA
MDDEQVFGPVLYKLSLASAVSRGLLARYQIIVLELQDPVLTPERLHGEDRYTEEVAFRDTIKIKLSQAVCQRSLRQV